MTTQRSLNTNRADDALEEHCRRSADQRLFQTWRHCTLRGMFSRMLCTLLLMSSAPAFTAHATWNNRSVVFGTPIERDCLHLQLVVGLGGGRNNEGLFHAVELGVTFNNGLTLAVLQTAVQNRGILGPDRGPDLIGGWMLELKVPVFAPELELKVAAGLGGVLDEAPPRPHLIAGFGWAYGLDLHLPVFTSSGPTLGLTFIHALVPAHYFTVGIGAGYTFF
jgi:hypothetical protein